MRCASSIVADRSYVCHRDAARQGRAGSNYAFTSGAANGSTIAVMCVIDNLVKGAAGGAMQWLQSTVRVR